MSKNFQAGKAFVDYITMMGFQFKETDSIKRYYVNEKGNQIRVDFESGLITLLDNRGNLVSYSSQYNNVEIDEFSVRENKLN